MFDTSWYPPRSRSSVNILRQSARSVLLHSYLSIFVTNLQPFFLRIFTTEAKFVPPPFGHFSKGFTQIPLFHRFPAPFESHPPSRTCPFPRKEKGQPPSGDCPFTTYFLVRVRRISRSIRLKSSRRAATNPSKNVWNIFKISFFIQSMAMQCHSSSNHLASYFCQRVRRISRSIRLIPSTRASTRQS